MAQVTVDEAEYLLEQLDTEITDYRQLLSKYVGIGQSTPVEALGTVKNAEGEEVGAVKIPPLEEMVKVIDGIGDILKKLYLERNKIRVALNNFRASQTFTI